MSKPTKKDKGILLVSPAYMLNKAVGRILKRTPMKHTTLDTSCNKGPIRYGQKSHVVKHYNIHALPPVPPVLPVIILLAADAVFIHCWLQ